MGSVLTLGSSVRTEMNCRTPTWCLQRTEELVGVGRKTHVSKDSRPVGLRHTDQGEDGKLMVREMRLKWVRAQSKEAYPGRTSRGPK